MELPREVLQKLVCEKCNGYLSRGPVHLMENTKYRCGRCPRTGDEEEGIRDLAYEEMAKLISFPCSYQANGCTSKVLFTDNECHEQACPYREYLCPIAESGQCEWTGPQTGILEHCQQVHPTNVVENPYKCTYDITRPSLNNYILFVFEGLFLIQSKVCTATRNIYHAVRLIGDPVRASDFKYKLDIQNNDRLIRIPGVVLPRGLLVLQEDTSVVTGINSLPRFLRDFQDTTFTVTIECSGQGSNTPDHVTPPENTLQRKVVCGKCGTEIKQRTCENSTRGCTYSDIREKCVKHECYFCPYSTVCLLCEENITGTTLDQHYTQAHGDTTYRTGTVCTVSHVIGVKKFMIDCDFGRAMCQYELGSSDLVLSVYTPLPSAQLSKYRCTVELSHPIAGDILTHPPAVLYRSYGYEDWVLCISDDDYFVFVHKNKLNMKINITKIDEPTQCTGSI